MCEPATLPVSSLTRSRPGGEAEPLAPSRRPATERRRAEPAAVDAATGAVEPLDEGDEVLVALAAQRAAACQEASSVR